MIIERYSKREFAARGLGTDEAKRLATELQAGAELELRNMLEPAVRQIVNRLNELGHNLKFELVDPGNLPGESNYGDYSKGGENPGYSLRFSADIVVTCGYPFKPSFVYD